MSRWSAAAWLLLGACHGNPVPAPLRVAAAAAGPDTRLTLIPAPGLKLNARLEPALELTGGGVIRFRSQQVTPDSAYFAEPPVAVLTGRHRRVHGILRASVCDSGASVCRTVELRL
jgi:hypothetical protein